MFNRRPVAVAELRRVLPPELLARLDLRTVTAARSQLVDGRLGLREGDLLLSARSRETGRLVYILVEHQSRSDRFMAFRLLRYVVRIWELLLEEDPGLDRLPMVIPVVLHHGRRPWTAPLELIDLIDMEGIPRDAVAGHLPSLRILVDDIARASDSALLERRGPPLLTATLAVLARAATMRNVERALGPFREALAAVARAPSVATHERLWHYVFAVSSVPRNRVLAFIRSLTPEVDNAMPTVAQQLIQEGRKEGRVEGRVAGRAEGQARLLQKLLRLKFGPLPAEISARVAAGTAPDLERWGMRLLTAETLGEVFARRRAPERRGKVRRVGRKG